jgi:hypothetical protein
LKLFFVLFIETRQLTRSRINCCCSARRSGPPGLSVGRVKGQEQQEGQTQNSGSHSY